MTSLNVELDALRHTLTGVSVKLLKRIREMYLIECSPKGGLTPAEVAQAHMKLKVVESVIAGYKPRR